MSTTTGASVPSWEGQGYGIWLVVYSQYQMRQVEQSLGKYLHPGDGIAVVLHYHGMKAFNAEGVSLHAAFPGVTLRGYTSLDGPTGLAGGLAWTIQNISPVYTQLSADYEIHGPVEFSPNFTKTLQYFQTFTKLVHQSGRLAIAYPTGRGVLGDYSKTWNYGAIANVTDGQTIETQGYCHYGKWRNATRVIWNEYNQSGQSLRTLSLQITIGNDVNACSEWGAIHAAKYWRQVAHGNIFFWWGPRDLKELEKILEYVET